MDVGSALHLVPPLPPRLSEAIRRLADQPDRPAALAAALDANAAVAAALANRGPHARRTLMDYLLRARRDGDAAAGGRAGQAVRRRSFGLLEQPR